MTDKTSRRPEFVEALARGLDVIQAFDQENPEMTLSEIAARTGFSPATARRSLITLQDLGYVGMHGKRYMLCAKVLSLGAAFASSMNLKDVADSFLRDVSRAFQETSSLAVREGTDALYVAHVPIDRDIRFRARVGYRLPLYATSLGRVLMAWCDERERAAYLSHAPFRRYTSRTICEAEALDAEWAKVRAQGYATAWEQLEYGVVSISVPVRDGDGNVVAAINCSTGLSRVEEADFAPSHLPVLTEAAQKISAALQTHPALLHSISSQL